MAKLIKLGLSKGIWTGLLSEAGGPITLRATSSNGVEAAVTVTPEPGGSGDQLVRIALPPELMGEGVEVLMVRAEGSDAVLANILVLAGDVLTEEMLGEVAVLRAEVDMLKRLVRGLVYKTGG